MEPIPVVPPAPVVPPVAPAPGIDEARLTSFGQSLLAQIKTMIAPTPTPQAERTVQERAKDVETKLGKIENAGRNLSLRELGQKIGVDPKRMDVFQREFAHAHGTGLKYDIEAGLSYVDELGTPVSVETIATKFLSSDAGSIFKAAPPVRAAGNPIRPSANSVLSGSDKPFLAELSPDARAKLTPSELAAYIQSDLQRSRAS